jgi:hypothetical protein
MAAPKTRDPMLAYAAAVESLLDIDATPRRDLSIKLTWDVACPTGASVIDNDSTYLKHGIRIEISKQKIHQQMIVP